MEVPKIGGVKGIFEILIPGSFLFINIIGLPLLLFYHDINSGLASKEMKLDFLLNPFIIIVIIICFGYLIGMILRLLTPDKLDCRSKEKMDRSKFEECYYTSHFPYIEVLKYQVDNDYYTDSLKDFFYKVWIKKSKQTKYSRHYFFIMIKSMVCFKDRKAAFEILTAESITRYLTGIYYSIRVSLFLIIFSIGLYLIRNIIQGFENILSTYSIFVIGILIFFLIGYYYSNLVLVKKFRLIRIKEVVTVLIASYKNRGLFL